MEYQHTNAIPEERNSSKPVHIPPNKNGRMPGRFAINAQDWQ
jgi:hypothetical protein